MKKIAKNPDGTYTVVLYIKEDLHDMLKAQTRAAVTAVMAQKLEWLSGFFLRTSDRQRNPEKPIMIL